MKTLNLNAAVSLLVMIVATSCSDNGYQSSEKQYQSELMKKCKDLVSIHNECLAKDRKLEIICFMTTYAASTQYWNENLIDWMALTNKPQTRASFQNIALADAWWGFQGMLASGLNPVVGGGLAAVASAGTAIWRKAEFAPDDIFLEDSIRSVETENQFSNDESIQTLKNVRNK